MPYVGFWLRWAFEGSDHPSSKHLLELSIYRGNGVELTIENNVT